MLPGLENPGSETGELAYGISYRKSRFSVEFKALGPRDAAWYHVVGPRKCVFDVMKENVLGIKFSKFYDFRVTHDRPSAKHNSYP